MDYLDLYNFQNDRGIIVPNDADVLTNIQDRFKAIFGSELDMSAETPVGRLIEAFAVLVRTTLGVNAQSANQFNISLATGPYLDALAHLFILDRIAAAKTKIRVRVYFAHENTGAVPAGSQITSSATGDIFTIDADIPNNGQWDSEKGWYGDGTATAQEYGPIPGDEGTVDIIQNAVLGWVGVTSTGVITVGRFEETDAELRNRLERARGTGTGTMVHIVSRLNRVAGVLSNRVLENNTSEDAFKNGIVLPPHSMFVCIYCGDVAVSDDVKNGVGQAIADVKPIGTAVVGYDAELSALGVPYYPVEVPIAGTENETIKVGFHVATILEVKVHVVVNARLYSGSDIVGDVKDAIIAYVEKVSIGDPVSTTQMASAITMDIAGVSVQSILLGRMDAVSMTENGNVSTYAYQKAHVLAENISLETV